MAELVDRDTYNRYVQQLKKQAGFVTITDNGTGLIRKQLFETMVAFPKRGKNKSKIVISPIRLDLPKDKPYCELSSTEFREGKYYSDFGKLMGLIKEDHSDVCIYDLATCVRSGDIDPIIIQKLSRTFKRSFKAAMQRNYNINSQFLVDISGLSRQEIYDLNLDFSFFQDKVNRIAIEEHKGERQLYWKNEFSPGDGFNRAILEQAHNDFIEKRNAKVDEHEEDEDVFALAQAELEEELSGFPKHLKHDEK